MKSIIAENARRIIKHRGLLQKTVAENAGYKPQTFSNMMNGRKIISDIDIVNIANVLDVDPNTLFGIEKEAI